MMSQWIALGVVMLALAGLVFFFARGGVKIKPHPERKGPSGQGGQPMV